MSHTKDSLECEGYYAIITNRPLKAERKNEDVLIEVLAVSRSGTVFRVSTLFRLCEGEALVFKRRMT